MGAGVVSLLTGIGATLKAMRRNGNGHVTAREWADLKGTVGKQGYDIDLAKYQMTVMQTTLDRHTDTLGDIRDDLARIMAAVDRRTN